jgi:hypothetical protein
MIQTITGNYNLVIPENKRLLTQQNIYLHCDTRNGEVNIALPRISKLNGFTPNIHIVDSFNNAGRHPINIIATATSENISGQRTKTINSSGASAVLRVISSKSWFFETYASSDKMPYLLGEWTAQQLLNNLLDPSETNWIGYDLVQKPNNTLIERFIVKQTLPFNTGEYFINTVWCGSNNWGSDNMYLDAEAGGCDTAYNYGGSSSQNEFEVWFRRRTDISPIPTTGKIAVWAVLIQV